MIWLVGIGGSLGALIRYLIGLYFIKKTESFPVGTFFVNSTGSFFLGALFGLFLNGNLPSWAWYFFGIGFCGAYTTFSTFGNETVKLFEIGKYKIAIVYVLSSVLTGIVGATIGLFLFL